MAVNKYREHFYVLPEDKDDQDLVNGFLICVPDSCRRAIQAVPMAGGWGKAVDILESEYFPILQKNHLAHIILVIDFDERFNEEYGSRLDGINEKIPEDLKSRVFIIGTRDEPATLKEAVRITSLEKIGEILAEECRSGNYDLWLNQQLKHNEMMLSILHPLIKQHVLL
ncbi:MAG: hypothetical protein JG718_01390 [Candidatus Thiothrix moscowensis]|nr:hypothetical protein [Candidatus Thiothrix moscowensis]